MTLVASRSSILAHLRRSFSGPHLENADSVAMHDHEARHTRETCPPGSVVEPTAELTSMPAIPFEAKSARLRSLTHPRARRPRATRPRGRSTRQRGGAAAGAARSAQPSGSNPHGEEEAVAGAAHVRGTSHGLPRTQPTTVCKTVRGTSRFCRAGRVGDHKLNYAMRPGRMQGGRQTSFLACALPGPRRIIGRAYGDQRAGGVGGVGITLWVDFSKSGERRRGAGSSSSERSESLSAGGTGWPQSRRLARPRKGTEIAHAGAGWLAAGVPAVVCWRDCCGGGDGVRRSSVLTLWPQRPLRW